MPSTNRKPWESQLTGAVFSPCRTYRYSLWRRLTLDPEPVLVLIGLNASTADERENDPTIRRCMGYGCAWNYGTLIMVNLFGYRATDPKVMKASDDPIGPDNMDWLTRAIESADMAVAAWGNDGEYMEQGARILKLFPSLYALKMNVSGQPAHPLYLPKTLTAFPINA